MPFGWEIPSNQLTLEDISPQFQEVLSPNDHWLNLLAFIPYYSLMRLNARGWVILWLESIDILMILDRVIVNHKITFSDRATIYS